MNQSVDGTSARWRKEALDHAKRDSEGEHQASETDDRGLGGAVDPGRKALFRSLKVFPCRDAAKDLLGMLNDRIGLIVIKAAFGKALELLLRVERGISRHSRKSLPVLALNVAPFARNFQSALRHALPADLLGVAAAENPDGGPAR